MATPYAIVNNSGNLDCAYQWIAWGAVEAMISVYVAILFKNILEHENSLDGFGGTPFAAWRRPAIRTTCTWCPAMSSWLSWDAVGRAKRDQTASRQLLAAVAALGRGLEAPQMNTRDNGRQDVESQPEVVHHKSRRAACNRRKKQGRHPVISTRTDEQSLVSSRPRTWKRGASTERNRWEEEGLRCLIWGRGET